MASQRISRSKLLARTARRQPPRNKELMSRLNIQHEFDPDDPMVIDKIKESVEGEAAYLERYQEEMRRYRKLMKLIHSESPLFRLPEEDLAAFYRDGDFKPPERP